MLKVCIVPSPETCSDGIRRVVDALHKYLPDFGVEVVNTPEEADVIHTHAGNLIDTIGKPVLNSSHGMMWSDYDWPDTWIHKANEELVEAMARADAHTAPSEWVANAIRRGMAINPTIIYHGVDADEFHPKPHQGFVFWNKARQDVVSNPADVQKLAELMPDVPFVTTLVEEGYQPPDNLEVCGVMPYAAMKRTLEYAGVYLATTRETFGIGTLEALACGVPVVGWDYGGQREIITDGRTGILVRYGDYDSLAEAVRVVLESRDAFSSRCLEDARTRWGWQDKVERYSNIYKRLYADAKRQRPKVSVVIPSHNLAKFLPQAIRSVQAQTIENWELIIVDDCSTDHSWHIAKEYAEFDGRISVYKTPENLGLCGTRNYGISKAKGKYIQFLDADDLLMPHALAVCSELLDNEPGIHIAYGHLDVLNETGTSAARNDWPFKDFSWQGQLSHVNMLHYSAMVRREVYERCGGYRVRHKKAEDAWYWCYVTSFGYRAEKANDARGDCVTTLLWRSRSNSKSIQERNEAEGNDPPDGDWNGEFPWAIFHDATKTMDYIRENGSLPIYNGELVPFGAQLVPEGAFWNVPHFAHPSKTYVVNGLLLGKYTPGAYQRLMDTLDAILLSPDRDWDCVVRLQGDWPSVIPGAMWAKVFLFNSEDISDELTHPNTVWIDAGETVPV